MNKKNRILIVEDDEVLRDGLIEALDFHEYQVDCAADALSALTLWQQKKPDLLILDLMLPDRDGLDVCRKIRQSGDMLPVLMLTAKGQEVDKLLGFECGTDDYMTKPFSIKELVARMKALLRRVQIPAASEGEIDGEIVIGKARVYLQRFTIETPGRIYSLSTKECEILRLLATRPGEVFHRHTILDRVWGEEYDPTPRTVDNFINKLRKKIEDDPARPCHLITVHGVGYALNLACPLR